MISLDKVNVNGNISSWAQITENRQIKLGSICMGLCVNGTRNGQILHVEIDKIFTFDVEKITHRNKIYISMKMTNLDRFWASKDPEYPYK